MCSRLITESCSGHWSHACVESVQNPHHSSQSQNLSSTGPVSVPHGRMTSILSTVLRLVVRVSWRNWRPNELPMREGRCLSTPPSP